MDFSRAQVSTEPLNSHLIILHDGKYSHAEFVLLSAYQTVIGHREFASEFVHLTEGFMVVGFRGAFGREF
jgi:hypothetical protein